MILNGTNFSGSGDSGLKIVKVSEITENVGKSTSDMSGNGQLQILFGDMADFAYRQTGIPFGFLLDITVTNLATMTLTIDTGDMSYDFFTCNNEDSFLNYCGILFPIAGFYSNESSNTYNAYINVIGYNWTNLFRASIPINGHTQPLKYQYTKVKDYITGKISIDVYKVVL